MKCNTLLTLQPKTNKEYPYGEKTYNSTLYLTSGLDGGEWSTPRTVRFTSGEENLYTLYRKIYGPQGWSGQVHKTASPRGFDPWTVQHVVSHAECAIPAHTYSIHIDNKLDYIGLFISPSGISELDCATTKTRTAERSISIGRESLQVFFCTRGLGVLPRSIARG